MIHFVTVSVVYLKFYHLVCFKIVLGFWFAFFFFPPTIVKLPNFIQVLGSYFLLIESYDF